MSIVILDRAVGPLPPYADWLRDSGRPLVLLTGRSLAEVPAGDYEQVECLPGYATSTEADRFVLGLAESTAVAALVATATEDLVRAGALRECLGVAGQGRDDALAFADPVTTRRLLAEAGVPAVGREAVNRISDLYWHAHRWGYPVRVRERKTSGWPTTAVLRDEADVRAYTRGGLAPDLVSVPALMAEPMTDGERRRLVVTGGTACGSETPGLAAVVDAALAALPTTDGCPYLVEAVRDGDGRWLVDTVAVDIPVDADGDDRRAAVRVQAGLVPDNLEMIR
ncbi:hypothetical protein ACFYSC_19920 [Streptosporangium sp. NPDC004379]|uniref:hypothetical protein n=1 Tax=Streptosporangium sp. NPDC004379 TaxID=3366189 RepID=UPI0036760EF8